MAAATNDRNIVVTYPQGRGGFHTRKVKGGQKLIKGAAVTLDASGFAYDGVSAANRVVDGYAANTVDNTNGIDGAVEVNIYYNEAILMENDPDNLVTHLFAGKIVYLLDNQTVTTSNAGAALIAGRLDQMDPDTGKPFVILGAPL